MMRSPPPNAYDLLPQSLRNCAITWRRERGLEAASCFNPEPRLDHVLHEMLAFHACTNRVLREVVLALRVVASPLSDVDVFGVCTLDV